MSATGRGGIRLSEDAYETPEWVYKQFEPFLLDWLGNEYREPKAILEPGAGTGNLVGGLHRTFPNAEITGVEIRGECRGFLEILGASIVKIGDFENEEPGGKQYDLIFGNPPFGGAKYLKGGGKNPNYGLWLRFVQRGLNLLKPDGRLVFLLRMAVLEAQERNLWMRTHVPDVWVLPKRPSFTGGGNDSAAYAWMGWRKDKCVYDEHEHSSAGRLLVLPLP